MVKSNIITRYAGLFVAFLALALAISTRIGASESEKPVKRTYAFSPAAPANQNKAEAAAKSEGCITCHTASDAWTMHKSEAEIGRAHV